MQHNRPFYEKKISVILLYNNHRGKLSFLLPKWIEQTYTNFQIIIVDQKSKNNPFINIKNILKRYGWSYTINEIHPDVKLAYLREEDDNLSYDKLIGKTIDKINSDIICLPGNSIPYPFYLDIAMLNLEANEILKCGSDIIYNKNISPSDIKTVKTKNLISSELIINSIDNPIPRCTVFIPVMDRTNDIKQTLPHWFAQMYSNYQIVIIDYSSSDNLRETVETICKENQKTFSNQPRSNTDLVYMRIDGMKYFNISHAYNWAIKQIETDIVLTVCADSVPWDYYLTSCANIVKNGDKISQIHWGLHALTKENWIKLNGHQEFIVGWGGEDDDFRLRAIEMGLNPVHLPSKLVYQIPQDHIEKAVKRQVKDLSESSLTNITRFNIYRSKHGFVGNYGQPIGGEQPIEYQPDQPLELPKRLWCFQSDMNPTSLPDGILYDEEFKLFYKISSQTFDCRQYTEKFWHFYIDSEVDLKKYLSKINSLDTIMS